MVIAYLDVDFYLAIPAYWNFGDDKLLKKQQKIILLHESTLLFTSYLNIRNLFSDSQKMNKSRNINTNM